MRLGCLLVAALATTCCHALRIMPQLAPQRHAAARSAGSVLMASNQLERSIQETTAANLVVIYSKSWCPYCAQCKALFDDMSQPYTAIELDQRDDGEQLLEPHTAPHLGRARYGTEVLARVRSAL